MDCAGGEDWAPKALILDFDGVIADSETLANQVLADHLSATGAPTTLEQSFDRYMGKRLPDLMAAAETRHGVRLPPDFVESLQSATFDCFRSSLQAVAGARDFLAKYATTPMAVASSSAPERLALCLDVLGLADRFNGHVYSAAMVPSGKPAPDVFLLAAANLGGAPADCIVVEDSASGVQAGVAAGMRVIGLLAGGHIRPGHRRKLEDAGAWRVVEDYPALMAILAEWRSLKV